MAQRRADGWSVGEIADAGGVSPRTVYKWLARASAENRSCRARHLANRLPDRAIAEIVRLRRQRLTALAIARRLRLARSTVAGWLTRLGLGRLKRLDPTPPIQRYERARAGEIVHLDIKKLGRFARAGHRVTGERRNHRRAWRGIGADYIHVAIDDATRVAYVEILPDETGASAAGFVERALAWLRAERIDVERVMTDNGPPYVSKAFAAALGHHNVRHLRTRPYTPRTNGKAERFIQTLLREWAYVKAYASSGRRNRALAPFIEHYNRRRPHASLAGKSPADALELKR